MSRCCPDRAVSVRSVRRRGARFLLPALLALAGVAPAMAGADCPLLEAGEVAHLLPAAVEAKVSSRDKPWPTCSFTWRAAHSVAMTVGGQVMEVPGEGRLTITMAALKNPDGDWQRVLISYGDQELLEVPAVGRRAVWSAQRKQLSVQAEGHLYHVALTNPDDPAAEYETAVRLGLLLVDMHG